MTLQEWREKRAEAAKRMDALFPRDEQTGEVSYEGEWTDEHAERYKAAKAEWEAANSAIDAMQHVAQMHQTMDQIDAAAKAEAEGTGVSVDESRANVNAHMAAFRAFAAGGIGALDDEQRELFSARAEDGRPMPRADVSVGTDAAGGFSVPSLVSPVLINKVHEHSGLLEVADVQTSETGRDISFTQIDWTDEKWRAKIVAENTAPGDETPDWGAVRLKFDVFKSPIVAFSEEFLMDTAIEGILMEIDDKLLYSIGWGVNNAMTNAAVADDGNAVGFTVDAAASGVNATAGGVVKVLDLAKLRQKINRRYRRGGRGTFMFNDTTMLDFITQEDDDHRPLWLPSTREGAPERIYGSPFAINDDMDDNAAGKKPVAYGDFGQFKVRVANGQNFGPTMRRFAGDVYGPKNQVAFVMTMRYAGRLVNSEAVKTLAGAA